MAKSYLMMQQAVDAVKEVFRNLLQDVVTRHRSLVLASPAREDTWWAASLGLT